MIEQFWTHPFGNSQKVKKCCFLCRRPLGDHCNGPAIGLQKLPESSCVLSSALGHPQQHSFSNPTERCFQFAQRPCRGTPTDQTHTHTHWPSLYVIHTHTFASYLSPSHSDRHLLRGLCGLKLVWSSLTWVWGDVSLCSLESGDRDPD